MENLSIFLSFLAIFISSLNIPSSLFILFYIRSKIKSSLFGKKIFIFLISTIVFSLISAGIYGILNTNWILSNTAEEIVASTNCGYSYLTDIFWSISEGLSFLIMLGYQWSIYFLFNLLENYQTLKDCLGDIYRKKIKKNLK